MVKGTIGFAIGAACGLLLAYVLLRVIKLPEWVQEDWTGLVILLWILFVCATLGLFIVLAGIVGMLVALHFW